MDPSEFMQKHGVMTGTKVIENVEIVQEEDKEKMKEFEAKLEREKAEIKE
jgi:hypothetical protein